MCGLLGLRKNVTRLFDNQGKLFVAALDHPQGSGVMPGLENPIAALDQYAESEIDGFILNAGLFKHIRNDKVYGNKLIMRVSLGSSKFSGQFATTHDTFVSKETVNQYGADAVLMMLILGGDDYGSMQQAAKAIDYYHSLSIPVILEVLASDYAQLHSLDVQRTGARIGAEIGADVMKVFYTERFEEVVQGCPVPVILAGGEKGSDVLSFARSAVSAGVSGFAFGRNIVQHEDPVTIIRQLNGLLR